MFKRESQAMNLIWAIIGKLVSGLKMAVFGVIIARHLGAENFGMFNYVTSFVFLFSVLAEFRLQNILTKEFNTNRYSQEILVGSSLVIAIFFSILGYILLFIFSYWLEKDDVVVNLILILGISYFFQIFRVLRSYYIAEFKNRFLTITEIITSIAILILSLVLVISKMSITWFVILRVVDSVILAVLMVFSFSLKKINPFKAQKAVIKLLAYESFPLVLSGISIMIFQRVDQVMIGLILDNNAVGNYSAAATLTGVVSFLPVVMAEALAPNLNKENGKGNFLIKAQNYSDILFWSSLVMSILLFLFSPFLIDKLFGNDFNQATELMVWFSFKGVLVAMGSAAAIIMVANGTHQLAYIKSWSGGIVNIALNYFLIKKYGINGAVFASLAAFFLSSYMIHLFIPRYKFIFYLQTKSIFRIKETFDLVKEKLTVKTTT
jgi:O-antigen/teichoic acid export membrane protein